MLLGTFSYSFSNLFLLALLFVTGKHTVTKELYVTSSNEMIIPSDIAGKSKVNHVTHSSTLKSSVRNNNLKDNITQSQNHKRNVSRINNYNDTNISSTKSTFLLNEKVAQNLSTNSKHFQENTKGSSKIHLHNKTTFHEESTTQVSTRDESQFNEDFQSKKKQIQALKFARQNAHSVKKDMNRYYREKISHVDLDKMSTISTVQVENKYHITVKKSLNVEKEFLIPQTFSTEQSLPNFNIGTDHENLTPSTQNTNKTLTSITTQVSVLEPNVEMSTKKSHVINYATIITSANALVLPTPHTHSTVMKTNFLSKSPVHKTKYVKILPSDNIRDANRISSTNQPKQEMRKPGKVPKIIVPVEEKIEDTVFYTDTVDPEDQFDKKNEVYKNNYLDVSEYQAILDRFFNGNKQNRKIKVPKNILSIDKLLEQNTKKPLYFSSEEPTIEIIKNSTHVFNETNINSTNQIKKTHASLKQNEHIRNLSTERIPQTIILKDLDNMAAAQDTNPFIHWDDINENQQLESYSRKNQDWFILQLTGKIQK